MAAILNFSKTLKNTCTSPYNGECVLEFLRPQKILELTSGGHFEFW